MTDPGKVLTVSPGNGEPTGSGPRFSLVVPAYNEQVLLPRLLASVVVAREQLGQPGMVEVIVANNGSTDRTRAVALAAGCEVVDVAKRGIGTARNAGALAARGTILCFVDADGNLHPQTFVAIGQAAVRPDVVGGATGVRPDRSSLGLAIFTTFARTLVRILGIDGGVVFCRQEAFAAIRGYREDLLVAEDVDFLLRLQRHGRAAQQRFVRLRGVQAVTSTRKFDQHGDWRFLGVMGRMAFWRLFSRRRADALAWRYWYSDR